MNITQEKIDQLNAVLKVTITEEDYSEKYNGALKDAMKKVSIPGFRPGKIPVGIVKKKYGRAILAEEIDKILSDSLNNYIQENKLAILGGPLPNVEAGMKGDWENPGEFEFQYDLGFAPQFEVKYPDKKDIIYYNIKIKDDVVDEQVDKFQRRWGKLENVDVAAEGDLLYGTFVQLDEKGEILPGGIMHNSVVGLEFIEEEKTKELLLDKKVGELVVLDPKKVSKGGADTAHMLGIKAEEVDAINTDFNFTINEVKHMDKAEVNQELFDKVIGEGIVDSEAAFREKLSEKLLGNYKLEGDGHFYFKASEYLLENIEFTLPNEFLKRWIMANSKEPMQPEELENNYDNYVKGLKWQLIENKLVEENEIKVEKEDADEFVRGRISNHYLDYGITLPNGEELETMVANAFQNQKEVQKIYETLYQQKVTKVLIEKSKSEVKDVFFDDFIKLAYGDKSSTDTQ